MIEIFSIVIFAPYAYNFFDLTFVDDEAEVIDGELEREYAHSACEPGENYDEPLCEKEIQWDKNTCERKIVSPDKFGGNGRV